MSLPVKFTNSSEYFRESFEFLHKYRWIYKESNTQYIAAGILECFPTEWINCLTTLSVDELNQLPFGYVDQTWPLSLKEFFTTLRQLKPNIDSGNNEIKSPETYPKIKGVNPKKLHEILNLSEEIHKVCANSVDAIIDVGSGLGYLSQMLHEKYGYKILGIESDGDRVRSAQNRQNQLFPKSKDDVRFIEHFVDVDSVEFINLELRNCFQLDDNSKMAIIGLHACADLTVAALKLFLNWKNVEHIAIMPCCYHKMKFENEQLNNCFENIPLCRDMNEIPLAYDVINRPFLRLAGQQTAARWKTMNEKEHNIHGLNMFVRAGLEAILLDENECVVRHNKKQTNTHPPNEMDLVNSYFILNKQTNVQTPLNNKHLERWNRLKEQHPNGVKLSEILTGLQACVQSLCENIVLLDKVCYANEMATELRSFHVNISIKKIMNEKMSPRCIVLIANKGQI